MRPPLRAVSVPLPGPPVDPLNLAGDDGVLFSDQAGTFASRGVALALPVTLADPTSLRRAQEALSGIEHEDRTGWGLSLRAFGALPFDRSAAGTLLLAELTLGRSGGAGPAGEPLRQWLTVVATAPGPDQAALALALRQVRQPGPESSDEAPRVRAILPTPAPELYADAVAKALTGIDAGAYSKVVLGRRLDVELSAPVRPAAVLGRLRRAEPLCTLFALPAAGGGRFLGATPELLLERQGRRVTARPLAGTVGLGAEAGADEEALARFLRSAKDLAEHRAVVDQIKAILGPDCPELRSDPAPQLVRLRSVAHLGTRIEGRLADPAAARTSVLGLLGRLHPTPAVGGVPREAALQAIAQLEPFPREQWAGPVGWVDGAGDGRFMVAIRSAAVSGATARLWAGAGIVAGSQPEAELAETTLKLEPVLQALAPGTAL